MKLLKTIISTMPIAQDWYTVEDSDDRFTVVLSSLLFYGILSLFVVVTLNIF